jgi:hypothetical protein
MSVYIMCSACVQTRESCLIQEDPVPVACVGVYRAVLCAFVGVSDRL